VLIHILRNREQSTKVYIHESLVTQAETSPRVLSKLEFNPSVNRHVPSLTYTGVFGRALPIASLPLLLAGLPVPPPVVFRLRSLASLISREQS
jgi:hypothetical protein